MRALTRAETANQALLTGKTILCHHSITLIFTFLRRLPPPSRLNALNPARTISSRILTPPPLLTIYEPQWKNIYLHMHRIHTHTHTPRERETERDERERERRQFSWLWVKAAPLAVTPLGNYFNVDSFTDTWRYTVPFFFFLFLFLNK